MREKLKIDGNVYSNEDVGIYTPPYYIDISGSGNAGLLLGQIRYWWERLGGKEFSMPLHRLASKIGITRRAARTAAMVLRRSGFIKCQSKQCGYAPKMSYWIFCEQAVTSAIFNFKAARNVNATKKINELLKADKPSNSAGPSNGLLSPTDGLYGQSDGRESPTYNNHSNRYLNSSSSKPSPSEAQTVNALEEEEEEAIINIMENEGLEMGLDSLRHSPTIAPNNIYYGKSNEPLKTPLPLFRADEGAFKIQPVNLKECSKTMLDVWNRLCPDAKVVGDSYGLSLHARFKDSFNQSYDEWEKYCETIASSKFLMGERPMRNGAPFKLSLVWALNTRTIEDINNGKYDRDRSIPMPPDKVEAHSHKLSLEAKERVVDEIENSKQDTWVKQLRRKCLDSFGAKGYRKFTGNGATFITQEDGHVKIETGVSDAKGFIESHRSEISDFLLSLGMSPDFTVKNYWDMQQEKYRNLPTEDTPFVRRKLAETPFSDIVNELMGAQQAKDLHIEHDTRPLCAHG
jgi:hypothetical protein